MSATTERSAAPDTAALGVLLHLYTSEPVTGMAALCGHICPEGGVVRGERVCVECERIARMFGFTGPWS